jgi:hypothetical protein
MKGEELFGKAFEYFLLLEVRCRESQDRSDSSLYPLTHYFKFDI